MQYRDEFDDPGFGSNVNQIVKSFDLRRRYGVRRPGLALGTLAALVAVLGGVIWYAYPRESAQRDMMNSPVIRADATPYRTAPEEPGGMPVPHRESTIFNTLRGASAEPEKRVENLLPPPEQPVSREQAFAGVKPEEVPAPVAAAEEPVVEEKIAAAAPAPAASRFIDSTGAAIGTTAAPEEIPAEDMADPASRLVPAPRPAREETPAAAAAAPATAVTPEKLNQTAPAAGDVPEKKASEGGFFVQLGSVKSRDAAAGEWKKFQSQNGELSGMDFRVQEADLGDKGVFYRIQGGPLAEAEAKTLCQAITARKPGGCLVVRR